MWFWRTSGSGSTRKFVLKVSSFVTIALIRNVESLAGFFRNQLSPWAMWTSRFVRPDFGRHAFIDSDLDPVDRCKSCLIAGWWRWSDVNSQYFRSLYTLHVWRTINIDMYTQYIEFTGKIHISVPRGLNRLFLGTKLPTSTRKKTRVVPRYVIFS